MKLIASSVALDLLLALTQRRDGARLAELADAVGAALSTVQRAVRLLLADKLVERHGRSRPLYRLRPDGVGLAALIDLAFASSPVERVMRVVLRADRAVEFAARDPGGHIVVEHPLADPRDALALDTAIERLERAHGKVVVLRLDHHEAIRRVRDDEALRSRVVRAAILKGNLARSFPGAGRPGERRQYGVRPRRRRTRAISAAVSRRGIERLARRHGLRRIRLFGSAARGELGPSSDVDVLVEAGPASHLSLGDLVRVEAELEELFDRHVDVVTPGGLRDSVREAAEREGITLYG